MEMLGITDYDVYQRQPQVILAYRRAFRAERARLQKLELDAMRKTPHPAGPRR